MTDKALELRRAYKREWAKRNPDKIREQQRRYWERKAAQAVAEAAPAPLDNQINQQEGRANL